MHAYAVPTSMPPPTPCSARDHTRNVMLPAMPHMTDASVKTTMDAITNGLRP
jgi:dTDP-4-amino-4,6-dideoxygalactose transaminase